MKTSQRIPKAIAVIVVVGVGLLHNMKDKSIFMEPIREITIKFDQNQIKGDSVQTNENKFLSIQKQL